jgi:WD repeat-containing protein 35
MRSADYQGIQFVKRLRRLDDKMKQKAEVAVYFQRFDEAESLYRDMDRKDLAIELRMRLGDWLRVVQLVQTGGAGDDELLQLAWNRIGDYYAERQKWSKAVQYYSQAKNAEALIDCYYILEDFAGLEALIERLPEGSPLLSTIGLKLQSVRVLACVCFRHRLFPVAHRSGSRCRLFRPTIQVGLSEPAVEAFKKAGDVKAAIDCCVVLNQWDQAVSLAESHEFPQIEGLLSKYASHLLTSGKTLQAIELFRKANRSTESAKLLAKLGLDIARSKANLLRAKRLYVLAALEVERFKKATMDMSAMTAATLTGATKRDTATATAATLDTLLKQDEEGVGGAGDVGVAARTLDNAWHGAEAVHFFLLAQRQLLAGQIDAAYARVIPVCLFLHAFADLLRCVVLCVCVCVNQHEDCGAIGAVR